MVDMEQVYKELEQLPITHSFSLGDINRQLKNSADLSDNQVRDLRNQLLEIRLELGPIENNYPELRKWIAELDKIARKRLRIP